MMDSSFWKPQKEVISDSYLIGPSRPACPGVDDVADVPGGRSSQSLHSFDPRKYAKRKSNRS
jgi:hypothetical protein